MFPNLQFWAVSWSIHNWQKFTVYDQVRLGCTKILYYEVAVYLKSNKYTSLLVQFVNYYKVKVYTICCFLLPFQSKVEHSWESASRHHWKCILYKHFFNFCHFPSPSASGDSWTWTLNQGILKGGRNTVPLASCLTGLESAVWQLTIFVFICKTD